MCYSLRSNKAQATGVRRFAFFLLEGSSIPQTPRIIFLKNKSRSKTCPQKPKLLSFKKTSTFFFSTENKNAILVKTFFKKLCRELENQLKNVVQVHIVTVLMVWKKTTK
jgi:hypothetical protein